ncbi:bifunctional nicotinamidase/pyrazinamidase [Vulgatibacter sp.]|uniref:bifunctional nicotinamidase/pyrazinamidase n=1 Tax=Vulgatibacter sp. TaxID=1971226 RepID=UPI00356933BD
MRALIVVDIQNDFLPGGALAVPHADEVVPVINRLLPCFELVVATKDWHPRAHGSFATAHPGKKPGDRVDLYGIEQVLWPPHCVQESRGAAFAPGLDTSHFAATFYKGVDPTVDSYSAFFDNARRRSTGLDLYLEEHGVRHIHLAGLATDYCVRATAAHGLELGLDVTVIEDACRGIDLEPGDSQRTLDDLQAAGVHVVRSEALLGAAATGPLA